MKMKIALLLFIFLTMPVVVAAKDWRSFDPAIFDQAKKANKTIFIHVHAPW